jgi:hypothetical protein
MLGVALVRLGLGFENLVIGHCPLLLEAADKFPKDETHVFGETVVETTVWTVVWTVRAVHVSTDKCPHKKG